MSGLTIITLIIYSYCFIIFLDMLSAALKNYKERRALGKLEDRENETTFVRLAEWIRRETGVNFNATPKRRIND